MKANSTPTVILRVTKKQELFLVSRGKIVCEAGRPGERSDVVNAF